jgi:cytochrome c oxidase assembly factor CtaG
VLAAVAVVLYVRAWRAERPAPPRWHAWVFGAGVATIVVALNSPLETIAIEYLVLFHLLQNAIITDWAPPLVILGLTLGMRAALAGRLGRPFAWLVRPQIALPVWLVGWYVIHVGAVYDALLRNELLLNLEHAFLIAIGLLFWWPVLSDTPHDTPTLARLAYVFVAFAGSAFLGLVLTFAPALYEYYEERPRLWGLSPDEDQAYGGILMSAEQAVVFLSTIVWLLLRLLREEQEAEQRLVDEQRALGLREH